MRVGVIGGTGVYSPGFFELIEERDVETPYGKPSDRIKIIKLCSGDMEVAFLPRHGSRHTIPPHQVNSRANVWALKELGVERIIGLSAVGSLREEIKPGDVVITDQFIDMTRRREATFYNGPKVVHISTADPFCSELREVAKEVIKELAIPLHTKGTYICVEGPRFSTRAESRLWRLMGADIIGMTLVPEVNLALELEMCYLCIATVTDYDVWAEKPVNTKEILETMKKSTLNVQRILEKLLPRIPAKRDCACKSALKDAGV